MSSSDSIQHGVAAPATAAAADTVPEASRGRRSRADSKRTTRKLSGFYLTAETVAKLKRHVFERQEAGEKIDASDVVEAALGRLLAD